MPLLALLVVLALALPACGQSNEWTISTLKELVETRINALKESADKSEAAQAKEFFRKTEADARFTAMEKQLSELQNARSRGEGSTDTARTRTDWTVTIIAAVLGAVVTLFVRKRQEK